MHPAAARWSLVSWIAFATKGSTPVSRGRGFGAVVAGLVVVVLVVLDGAVVVAVLVGAGTEVVGAGVVVAMVVVRPPAAARSPRLSSV